MVGKENPKIVEEEDDDDDDEEEEEIKRSREAPKFELWMLVPVTTKSSNKILQKPLTKLFKARNWRDASSNATRISDENIFMFDIVKLVEVVYQTLWGE